MDKALHWAVGGAAVTPLADALKILPQLGSVEVRNLLDQGEMSEYLDQSAKVVLSALNFSGIMLKKLSLGNPRGCAEVHEALNIWKFSLPAGARSGLSHLTANLDCLELTLDSFNVIEDVADPVWEWLHDARSLRSLQISYSYESFAQLDLHTEINTFLSGLSLPQLTSLRFYELRCYASHLSTFLKAHAKTLRDLHLQNVEFIHFTYGHDLYKYLGTSCRLTALTQLSLSRIVSHAEWIAFNAEGCKHCLSQAPFCFGSERSSSEDEIVGIGKRLCPHVTFKAHGLGCVSVLQGKTQMMEHPT